MQALILASSSVYRKGLVERLGLKVDCIAPGVDEEDAASRIADPVTLAETLALDKARVVAANHPGRVVIAGDQLVAFQGRILGKPGSSERALEQLIALSGRTHELITAMVVVDSEGRPHPFRDVSRLTMRSLSVDALRRYVEADNPVDCAGAYKIESAGIALFESIETADFTAITGLPLLGLVRILGEIGVDVP